VLYSARYAEGTQLLCHFGMYYPLTRLSKPAKSFASPTSMKFAPNPFVSPTSAKTGGYPPPLP